MARQVVPLTVIVDQTASGFEFRLGLNDVPFPGVGLFADTEQDPRDVLPRLIRHYGVSLCRPSREDVITWCAGRRPVGVRAHRDQTEQFCHCGADMCGSDRCPQCGCEAYERYCNFVWKRDRARQESYRDEPV